MWCRRSRQGGFGPLRLLGTRGHGRAARCFGLNFSLALGFRLDLGNGLALSLRLVCKALAFVGLAFGLRLVGDAFGFVSLTLILCLFGDTLGLGFSSRLALGFRLVGDTLSFVGFAFGLRVVGDASGLGVRLASGFGGLLHKPGARLGLSSMFGFSRVGAPLFFIGPTLGVGRLGLHPALGFRFIGRTLGFGIARHVWI